MMMMNKVHVACLLFIAACSFAGCDQTTRYKALSTLFDGVPSLPPPEQFCSDYAEKRIAEVRDELTDIKTAKVEAGATHSKHLPYGEKSCNKCHDKSKKDGLIAPRNQLCFVCHSGFIRGLFVHGPVAVGDCLACHLPHSSGFPLLLKTERSAICSICHHEKRIASGLHEKVAAQQIACVDCHDPHFGKAAFFLK
jgi:predicted CXXCH cytochrome family protein